MTAILEAKTPAKSTLTPMMQQYMAIKKEHPNDMVFYRMGDFYELFDDDAVVASKVLGLTLTSRNNGASEKTPLGFEAVSRNLRIVRSSRLFCPSKAKQHSCKPH